jgi:WD40 repeat protein
MYSMSLTIRKDGNRWSVEGETSEPALAAGTRASAPLELDVNRLQQLAVARDLDDSRAYGRMLGEAVFVGDIRAIFHEVLDRVPHDDVLHVSFSVEDVELRSLRWERLCCPLHNRKDSPWEFLHLRQETAFSLDLRSANDRPYPAISRVGLKALVVVADMGPTRPYKLAEFNASETVAGIRAALGKEITSHVLASSGESQLPDSDGLPTLDEICRSLSGGRFAILHLVCHGEFKQWEEPGPDGKPVSKSDTFLYLRKPGEIDPTRKDDYVARVSGTDFLQRLRQLQALPHLTFLCSCSSASTEAEQGLGGLGQRLVRELAMPAVVAMTEPVPIDLASQISREFYNHLRQTGEVDRALTKASASQAGRPAILVPTHFSRLAGRRLFDDSLELTTAEWEHGLNRIPALIQERAPVLATTFDKLLKVVQPALEIWRTAERSDKDKRTEDEKQAGATLQARKAELNELCQDFLENSFDHLAKDKQLTFPTYDGRCPFPGLGVFDKVETGDKKEDFRPFFFGRDLLIREIHELLNRNHFVAVLGGSGSGKSSLIRAGLLEAMRRDRPELQAIVFPPGKDPLARLQTELAAIPNPRILVVDQFEELFTLCTDLAQRKEFLKQLLPLKDQFPVVITMRADFLGECAGHDDLHQLLDAADDKHLKLIQPLKGNELRSVVELQAQAVGLRFEPGLTASIIDDLEGEPGAMPLLQHCLRQLWQHRHGRWLRLTEYANEDRVGGVKGAISRTAEDVYQQLVKDEPEASTLLPFIFERLARIDTDATEPEQRRDTRRREELSELTPAGSDTQVVKRIITKLADAKLIVTTQNPQTRETEVELAHEALIRNWPRLQTWLDAARDTARLVERIRNDADSYSSKPTTDNLTLRGSVLAEAEALIPVVPRRLNEPEEQFVRDCRRHENALKDAKDRLRTSVIVGLALGLTIAIALGTYSYYQRNSAIGLALMNGQLATDVQSKNDKLQETLYLGNIRLAASAHKSGHFVDFIDYLNRCKPSQEGKDLRGFEWRHMNSYLMASDVTLETFSGAAGPLAYSEKSGLLACGSKDDGRVMLWKTDPPSRILDLPARARTGARNAVSALAFSADGQKLAVGYTCGSIAVVDSRGVVVSFEAVLPAITCVMFSPEDQGRIAFGTAGAKNGGSVGLWDWMAMKGLRETSFLGENPRTYSVIGQSSALAVIDCGGAIVAARSDGSLLTLSLDSDLKDESSLGRAIDVAVPTGPKRVVVGVRNEDAQSSLLELEFTRDGKVLERQELQSPSRELPQTLHYFPEEDLLAGGPIDELMTWKRTQGKPLYSRPRSLLNRTEHGVDSERISDWVPFGKLGTPSWVAATQKGRLIIHQNVTFQPIATAHIPGIPGTSRMGIPSLRWSADGRAFAVDHYYTRNNRPNADNGSESEVLYFSTRDTRSPVHLKRKKESTGSRAYAVACGSRKIAFQDGEVVEIANTSETGLLPTTLPIGAAPASLCLSADEKKLFTASTARPAEPEVVSIWDLDAKERVVTLEIEKSGGVAEALLVECSSDDRFLAACGSSQLVVWSLTDLSEILRVPLPSMAERLFVFEGAVVVAFESTEGPRIVSWSLDSTKISMTPIRDQLLPSFIHPRRIGIHQGLNRFAISTMPGLIRLLNESGVEILQLEIPQPEPSVSFQGTAGADDEYRRPIVVDISFSPDGQSLAVLLSGVSDFVQILRSASE